MTTTIDPAARASAAVLLDTMTAQNRRTQRGWWPSLGYVPRHEYDTIDSALSLIIASRRIVEAAVALGRRPYVNSGVLDGYTAHLQLRPRHAAEPDAGWYLEDQALAHAQRKAEAKARERVTCG